MNKKLILEDIRKVAKALGRAPTRDEYQSVGRFSKHVVAKFFENSWENAIIAAGLQPVRDLPSLKDDIGFKYAQKVEECKQLRDHIRDLEDGVMSSRKIKELIGTVDCDSLGGDARDWIKGSKNSQGGTVNGIPTLFLSDWHFDEVVSAAQVRYMNEYNRDIAEKRLQFTFTKAIDLLKNHLVSPKYEGIICPLGGDLVSGNIHEELSETNEEVINKTIIHWADQVASGIGLLADEFGKVFVPCVVGNHGRHHKKPRAKNYVTDNYEWIMYHIIARSFKGDSRVSFMIPESEDAFYEVYGMRVCLSHGNQFRGGDGVGGIMVPIMRGLGKKQSREAAIDKHISMMIIGHWHQYVHMRNLVINGAGKGYDEYAFKNNFAYEPPTQALWIHHKDRGVVFPMSIICSAYEDKKESRKPALVW